MTRNTLLVAAAVVGAFSLSQANAAYKEGMTQQQTDYERYARVVLGAGDRGDRSATGAARAEAPAYETYRSVVQGRRFESTGMDAVRRIPVRGFDAYQRAIGGRLR
jgi:hypothetical protein